MLTLMILEQVDWRKPIILQVVRHRDRVVFDHVISVYRVIIMNEKRGATADFRIQVLENLEDETSNSPTHIPRVI